MDDLLLGMDKAIRIISIGAAYRTLQEKNTSEQLAEDVIEAATLYLNTCTLQEKIDIRREVIMAARDWTPRLVVTEGPPISATEGRAAIVLMGRRYATPILRKVVYAMKACARASEQGTYLGVIEVSSRHVTIATLPWAWGSLNWQWQFRPRVQHSQMRDHFMLITGCERVHELLQLGR